MADETLQQQPPTFSDELYKYAHDSGFIPKEATVDIFKKNLSNKDFVKELYDYSVQTEFIPKEATIDIFIKNIGGTNPAEKKNEKPATVSPVGGGSSGLLSVKFGGEDYEVNPTTQQVFKGGKPVTVPAHIKDYIEKNIIGSKPKDKPAEKPYVAKGAVILPEDYFDKKAMPKETAWLISDLTGMDMTALQNSPQVVDEAFKDLSTYTGIAVDKTSNPETITKAIGQAKMLRDTKEFTKLAKDAGVTEKKALEIAYDNAADKFLDSGDKELWALTKQVNQAFEGGDKATVDKLMPVWEKARKQFIDNRHDKITSLHNMIITGKNVDGVPLTSAAIEDLKKEKNLLTKQLNGFFKSPEAVVKDVVGSTPMLSVFDKQLEGKTGQQKLETIAKPMLARYFLLGKKMGVKTEDIMGEGNTRFMQTDKTYLDDVKNYMGIGDYDGEVTSSDRKEFNDLHNKLGIIMPMLLINKIPVQDVEDKPVDILKKGALSMTPALATMNQTGQQKTNTLNDILALANITPDDLTQDALTSINTNMKKYGWAQDLAQMGGSTLSIMLPMMLAETGAGFAIESLALNPRTAMVANFLLKNPVGKVIKGGTTFSAAGKISDGEELDFGTGAASGVVDVVLDALGSKNKAMAKWFISTFGKRATKIAAIAAKPIAKGTGEFFQESGETVYQAWRDTPEGKSVMETLQKQFPDADSRLKFFVGTVIMGVGMGLAGDIGFGGAKKRAYDALSPENKAKADAFMATRNQKAKDAVDEVVPVASNDAIENNLKVAKEAKEKLEKLANRDVEAEDKVIADFQQRTGYEPTLVEDVPKSIDTTLSRIDNGLPVDQTAKDELADWAYEQYKKLSLLKKSDARKATTAQIQQAQDYLEGIITNINDEITAKKIEAEKDTEGITPYSIEVDGVTYSGSTLQDLQRDIDFLDHVENTANDELYKRNTGQTETPPIAEADQTDVELAKPEAGVGVEGEVVPEDVKKRITELEDMLSGDALSMQEKGMGTLNDRQSVVDELADLKKKYNIEPKPIAKAAPTFENVPVFTYTPQDVEKAKNEVFDNLSKLQVGSVIENSDGEIKVVTDYTTDKKGNKLIGVVTFTRLEDGSLLQRTNPVFASKSADGKIKLDYNPHTTGRNAKGEQVTVTDQITDKTIDLSKENIFIEDENGNLVKTNAFSTTTTQTAPTTTQESPINTANAPETVQNAQENGQNVEDKKAETKEAYVTRRKDEIFKQLKNKYPTLITGDAINPMIVQPKYMSIEDVELAQKVLDPRILELEYDAELAALKSTQPVDARADIERRRKEKLKRYDERDARDLETIMPNNPNHPKVKVGMKYNTGMNASVEKVDTDNWDGKGEGYAVVTAVISPAEVDEDGEMTKAAKINYAIFNSKEEADKAIQEKYEKVKSTAGQKQKQINAEYDAELAALNAPTTTTSTTTEILPQGGEVKETVSDTQVSEPLKSVESTAKALENTKDKTVVSAIADKISKFNVKGLKKFFHASDKKRKGRLVKSNAPQFGTGVYFSTNKDLVKNEFGEEVTEVTLNLQNPVRTGTPQWNAVKDLAVKKANEGKQVDEDGYIIGGYTDVADIPSRFISDAATELGYDAIVDEDSKDYENEITVLDDSRIIYAEDLNKTIAEAYHKAKADGSNPDLVQAVEELLAPKGEVKAEPSTKTPPTEKVEAEPTADIDNVADKAGIAPKNLRDLYNINRTLFGLNKVKSLAAAVAMDRMVGVMAKRAGITKAEMYGRLEFKKDTEANVLKADNALFQGTVNGENVTLRNTDVDVVNGFYSPLRKIIAEAKQDKMPAKQWIEKFARGEEAKWTGLTDWLASQQGSVSKADILDYLKNNRISIVEVVKEDSVNSSGKNQIQSQAAWILLRNGDAVYDRDGNVITKDTFGTVNEYFADIEVAKAGDIPKFSQYQLEGDKSNYKEVLVTLPSSETEEQKQKRIDDIDKKRNELKSKIDSLYNQRKDETKEYKDLVSERERLLQERNKIIYNREGKDFRSSHFSEPNILVHLRMNTRTDAEGNKVLFLEEIQSDWGQEGKRKGFSEKAVTLTPENTTVELSPSGQSYRLMKDGLQYADMSKETGDDFSKKDLHLELIDLANKYAKNEGQRKTPTAPFVTDTNAWVKLGLKVALKEAVAQGADKIAWTTGEQQNDRYDLSKQVDKIDVEAVADVDNLFFVDISLSNGTTENLEVENGIIREGNYKGQRLDSVIGKDYADKIMSTPKGESVTLQGADLKVGGKGMKGFYGSPTEGSLGIVGNAAKSLFKQDVGTVKITNKSDDPFTAKYDPMDELLLPNGYEYRKSPNYTWEIVKDNKVVGSGDTKNDARWDAIFTNNMQLGTKVVSTQNSITVTPELRTQVQNGLALFQKQQGQTAKGAMVAADGKFIIYALTDPNVSTPLHELAHVFEHYLTDSERAAVNNWAKTGAWTTETSEKFARGFEKYLSEGIAPTEGLKKVFEKFKTWLTDIYNGIKGSDIDIELNDDMRSIYAKMLGEDAVPTKKTKAAPKKAKKAAIQSDVIDKLVGNAANRREAYKEIADENIKEVAKIITDTNGKFDKVMDAIDNNDQLLADLEKKLGIKKICRI